MHNLMPMVPSNGIHVPFHTIVMEPFQHAFTFGSKHADVKGNSHIGLESTEDVAGAFMGSQGQFLVTSPNQFVILTPLAEHQPPSLGMALFPKKETHTAQEGLKGKSYSIIPGSCIMAYNFDSDTSSSLKSITVFMGVGCGLMTRNDVYRSAQGALAQSLIHFNAIWNCIVKAKHSLKTKSNDKNCADEDTVSTCVLDLVTFDPEPNIRERQTDMQVPISKGPCRNASVIPVVTAYPIPEDRLRLLEKLENKRQKTPQQKP